MPLRLDEEALSSAYTPRRMALLVGISEFDDPHWRGLRYTTKDATDLAEALKDPKRGRFDHVRVLTRPEETTRASILAALRQLRKEAHRPDDVVVVYFSAHGTLARDNQGELRRYLVTRDASFRAIPQTALSMDALKAEFDGLSSRRRLLVLATCHSGSGKSLLPKELEVELAGIKAGFYARPLEESSRASLVFAACDWGETAREDEGLRNDIYTHFLIEGLGGTADRNVDGAVTATEAHDYARRRTFAFTEGRQRPSAEILEVGADPVVLSGSIARTGRPELFSYNPRLDGFTLKVDGEPRTDLPGGAAVVPGKRTVELTKGDAVLVRREVDIGVGERLPLERLLSEASPAARCRCWVACSPSRTHAAAMSCCPGPRRWRCRCGWRTSRSRTSRCSSTWASAPAGRSCRWPRAARCPLATPPSPPGRRCRTCGGGSESRCSPVRVWPLCT
ncbi:caspase domain-containing protein [Pyxidicoccus sp. 3LFB2]